jgi:hypothetical protein
VVFVTTHESERDFGSITLLFSIAPLSRNFILTYASSQIHVLSATLGCVYDLSFPIDLYMAVVSRNMF